MPSNIVNCSNCNVVIDSNFCPDCGQQISKKPLSLFSLIKNSFAVFADVERSVFSLVYYMIINPKKIIHNYWNGFSKFYPGPSKLLLYSIAIVALHFKFFGENIIGLDLKVGGGIKIEYAFFCFVFPFLFLSAYLTFIRKKKSIAKHLSSFTYISCTLLILLIFVDDLIFRTLFALNFKFFFFIWILLIFIWNSWVFEDTKHLKKHLYNLFLQVFFFLFVISLLLALAYLFIQNPENMNLNVQKVKQ